MSGIRISTTSSMHWSTVETKIVHGLLVFFRIGLDSTSSSNILAYLLPAGAKRPLVASPERVLLPAADPVPATAPWPRQWFQATTMGAAMPKLEYVPTTIPTTRAKEKLRRTCPPIRKSTRTVRNVRPLVRMVQIG